MDLDKALVSSLLAEGKAAVNRARERGIQADYLQGDGRKALEFVIEYVGQYGDAPDPGMVTGKTGIVLDPPVGVVDFYIDEILNRRLHTKIQTGVEETISELENRSPKQALEAVEKMILDVRRENLSTSKIESIPALSQDVLDFYNKIKAGMTGILTPWAGLNEATLGFWPQDLVLFVARLGVGKTWVSLLLAQFAWEKGKHKVLYATTEVSKIKIATRFCAIQFKLPYKELRKGKLSVFSEQKFIDGVNAIMNEQGLYIVGGFFDFRVESLAAAIDECKPDIVVLDGAYLLRVQGNNRFERAANVFDELKRLANRTQIPFILTSQLNREAKSGAASAIRADSIALTDVAGWNADVIFGMVQTEDMKRDRRLVFKPLKIREGEGEDIEINWNIDAMDFSELPRAGGTGDADEFGTGVNPAATGGSSDPGDAGTDPPF